MALRIEQDPLQLLDVRHNEVDQHGSGLRPDVAFHRGDGGPAALDQLGDDGRIGLDRGWRAACRRPARALVRKGRNEVTAFEDGLQRVPDQRIGSPLASQLALRHAISHPGVRHSRSQSSAISFLEARLRCPIGQICLLIGCVRAEPSRSCADRCQIKRRGST
jgi:hypothetical protein